MHCPARLVGHASAVPHSAATAVAATGLVSSGQLTKTLAFLTKHPEALGAIMLLSCASSCGEWAQTSSLQRGVQA